MHMNNIWIATLDQPSKGGKRQKGDTLALISRPLKGGKTANIDILLDTANATCTRTWSNYPDLMASIDKVDCQAMSNIWNSPHHWRILICHNHNTHLQLLLTFSAKIWQLYDLSPTY